MRCCPTCRSTGASTSRSPPSKDRPTRRTRPPRPHRPVRIAGDGRRCPAPPSPRRAPCWMAGASRTVSSTAPTRWTGSTTPMLRWRCLVPPTTGSSRSGWRGSAPARLPGRAEPAARDGGREIDRLGDHPGFVQVLRPVHSAMPYAHAISTTRSSPRPNGHALAVGLPSAAPPATRPPSSVALALRRGVRGHGDPFPDAAHEPDRGGRLRSLPAVRVALSKSGFAWLARLPLRFDKEWKGLRGDPVDPSSFPLSTCASAVRITLQPIDGPADAGRASGASPSVRLRGRLDVLDGLPALAVRLAGGGAARWTFPASEAQDPGGERAAFYGL